MTTFSRRSFLIMPLALAACKPREEVLRLTGQTMGTRFNIVALNDTVQAHPADLRAAVDSALAEVNGQMSNWDAGSEISRFNAQSSTDAVSISAPLADVMQAAASVNRASRGGFDTTVGPLIELWGFGAPGATQMPTPDAIAAAQERSGHANTLALTDSAATGQLRKTRSDAQIYLAAIGKGYGADHVARALTGLGYTNYMVEIGGDLVTAGHNAAGLPWQIGIETPAAGRRDVLRVVGVRDHGLASSGDYRNYFEQDGHRYSHLIDPRSGRPVDHRTASATVLAENAMLADAWSTAMLILGREEGLALAQELDLAVLFIDRDPAAASGFATTVSPRFANLTA